MPNSYNMLKLIKNLKKKKPADKAEKHQRPPLDKAKLCEVIGYYPIGNRVRYYPEYKEEVTLDTLVIAYELNGHLLYSNAEIECCTTATTIVLNGKEIETVESFSILVPPGIGGEGKLDYERKESLGESSGFSRGNTITLLGPQVSGLVPTLDTVADKFYRFRDGVYAGERAVILIVDPRLLTLTDQRKHTRLETAIPVQMKCTHLSEPYNCMLSDLSDRSVRISCLHLNLNGEEYKKGKMVTLTFNLPESDEMRIIRGTIYRNEGDALVVTLQTIMRKKTFEKLKPIDIMEIKAKLLQHQN